VLRFIAAVMAVLALGACGQGACTNPCAAVGPWTPPATPPVSPTAGFDVLITDTDRAVTVKPGQRLELILHAKPGMSGWSGVNVDDYTVLRAIPTGITAPPGVTVAGYEAERRGTATIRATATPLCTPGAACPQFAMIFEVTVTVV
jgi:hypothetical protein